MAFQQSVISDGYRNLLDDLQSFATGRHVSAFVVNAGGTGYVVGDILTVVGGTSTFIAQARVTAVSGGVITGVVPENSGAYTVDPTTTANAVTGGTGSTATLDLTMKNTGWTVNRDLTQIGLTKATLTAAGSGYAVNDVLTIVGGTGTAATITVNTVGGGGEVLTFTITTVGSYTVTPTPNPLATTVVPSGGTGATFNGTFHGVSGQDELQLVGEGVGGTDSIYVGIRTYIDGTAENFELAGFTGHDISLPFTGQPGFSNGQNYVPLIVAGTNITSWFVVNGGRIAVISKISTTYVNMYLGFVNRFATAGEFPYPLLVMGCTSQSNLRFNSTLLGFSGLCDPISHATVSTGPGMFRYTDGVWYRVTNGVMSGSNRSGSTDLVVAPCGQPAFVIIDNDKWWSDTNTWLDVIPNLGNPGSPSATMKPTPNSGGVLYVPIPATLLMSTPASQIVGEMDNVFWVTGSGMTAEDIVEISNVKYFVTHNCNRSETFSFVALKLE